MTTDHIVFDHRSNSHVLPEIGVAEFNGGVRSAQIGISAHMQ